MSELVDAFDAAAEAYGSMAQVSSDAYFEAELEYMRAKDALVRHIRNLEAFHRQVTKAAGDLTDLPDGHAFEIHWCLGEDGEPEPGAAFITAGMIRRAAATREGVS